MARIVHWGKYYPPDMGGIESVTSSLARGAGAAGHDATAVCFGKDEREAGREPHKADWGGVRVLRAPIAWASTSQPVGWRYFSWLLKEGRRADIVHLHAPNMLAALAAAFLGARPKLVVHWHSDVIGKGALGRLLRPVEAMMLRRADRVICTSPPYAEASPMLQPYRHKIAVVPLGAPDTSPAPVATPNTGGETPDLPLPAELLLRLEGRRLILSVGRLVPYKGFDTLIDAAPLLPEDAVVIIVGTGPLHAALDERIAAAGAHDRIILAGRLENDALQALFTRAALYCMPSVERSEAFGVVLIEAMSYGLPVIATTIPGSGVPWVNQHGESGLNVSPADAGALAQACTEILANDGLREHLAKGARRRFEAEFCENISVSRMNELYDELHPPCGGSSPRGTSADDSSAMTETTAVA